MKWQERESHQFYSVIHECCHIASDRAAHWMGTLIHFGHVHNNKQHLVCFSDVYAIGPVVVAKRELLNSQCLILVVFTAVSSILRV